MDPAIRQVYEHAVADMQAARTQSERAEIPQRVADVLGVSLSTVYRNLKTVGWDSGRKEREDKGSRSLSEEDLREISRIMAKGRNKLGEPNMPLTETWRLAGETGMAAGGVSYSTLGRQLRETGLGLRHMMAPAPAIARVSRHPNHVWFFDPSVAVPWFFHDENGKRLGQYMDAGARFYMGKWENIKVIRRIIYRYLMVDHYSGAFYVRYYYSSGERYEDTADFFFHAMSKKGGDDSVIAQAYPFRGIPWRMVADQGPGFKNGIIQSLLGKDGLNVKTQMHEVGNAKASGTVESRHNHWQRAFEGRTALRPIEDLAELNALAEQFCAACNAERNHDRHGQPPIQVWSTITREQLVECPDRKTFFRLATSAPKVGTLDNRLYLQHDNRFWLLRGENLYPGQKITYKDAPFLDVGIRCWDEFKRELAAEEIRRDKAGFPLNGRFHVWDEEEHAGAAAPLPPAQQVSRAVVRGEDEVHLENALGGIRERLEKRAQLAPEGQTWQPAGALPTEPPMGSLEAREEIVRRLGRPLGADGAWWRDRIGNGVTPDQLEALWEEFTTADASAAREVS